jgi:HK97 gp10 family phage protein
MADRVVVEGEARLRATLAVARRRIETPTPALTESARLVETRGRSGAPVRTGALAGSIRGSVVGQEAIVTAAVRYGVFVEYGTSRTRAQPFLRPALEASTDTIVRAFEDNAQAALAGVRGA